MKAVIPKMSAMWASVRDTLYPRGMTNLAKFVNVLSGWDGGPGVNVMWFSAGSNLDLDSESVQAIYDEVRSMYAATSARWLAGVSITVDPAPSIVDVATGALINVIPVGETDTAVVTSGGSSNGARATAFVMKYTTDVFLNGRRLQGRSFFGPTSATDVGNDGQVATGCRAVFDDNFEALTTGLGPRLAVYHRPTTSIVNGQPVNNNDGAYGDVAVARMNLKPGVLKSRRD